MRTYPNGIILLSGRLTVDTGTYISESHNLPKEKDIGYIIRRFTYTFGILDANTEYVVTQVSDVKESDINPIDAIIYDGYYCIMAGAAYYFQHPYSRHVVDIPEIIISKAIHVGFKHSYGALASMDYRLYLEPVQIPKKYGLLREVHGA